MSTSDRCCFFLLFNIFVSFAFAYISASFTQKFVIKLKKIADPNWRSWTWPHAATSSSLVYSRFFHPIIFDVHSTPPISPKWAFYDILKCVAPINPGIVFHTPISLDLLPPSNIASLSETMVLLSNSKTIITIVIGKRWFS